MSSFTTGDSGYGKSLEKDGINDPCTSQASFCNQTWKKNSSDSIGNNMENFSTCLALTEETLSVHNRMQHKHLKQHQRKNKVTLGVSTVYLSNHHQQKNPLKDSNWFQQKESGHVKHKKSSHSHNLTASTPTQTDLVKVTPASQSVFRCQASVPSSVSDSHANSMCTPNISHPCIFPPNNCTGSPATPTPFFIPVVYMGSMPYYPPLSAVHPQTGGSFWPCSPSPPNEIYTGGFPFPIVPPSCSLNSSAMTPPCSVHSSTVFPAGFPYPANANCNALSGNPYGVRSSGVTTTTLLTTTTTTVASGTLHTFKNTVACSVEPTTEKQVPKLKDVMSSKKFVKTEVTESDMQIDDTQSSFTQSSSFQSAEKDEDMDIEMKKNYAQPPHPDKIELSADIAYRYQMNLPNVEDVLKKDMEALKSMHQPELVNKQLQQLQNELKDENDGKAATSGEFCMTEAVMLGFTTEDEVSEELEYREASLLQLMCEDS
ncbi:uncharacterized protein LOC118200542 isoform X2 [Stegodyphus dumicola]|uniref:uncharacterized protein LOC118200542 isoform X2 n=1 Tax=Stegodyphus dumicola TaxID=202533 RepID=UPI0015AB66EE|nr:uncharacterized protein LOC118200542 isoform X2 [Stegodyphus dumicola]